jgi:ATP-dependent Clp protease protease subunit
MSKNYKRQNEDDPELEPEAEQLACKKEESYTEEYYFRILNNHRYILLYDVINNVAADLICSKLRAMNYLDKKKPIYLEISSPGGAVSYGLAIVDTINQLEAPVYTIVTGDACSMAAIISIVGKKRFMTKNAVWMNHSTSDLVGDYLTHIKDRTNFLVKLEKKMNNILSSKTKLTQAQRRQMRNGELWLFAEEALKAGVVDKII